MTDASPTRLPVLYIPHGGGPCFFMPPMAGLPADTWDGMAAFLRAIPALVGTKPKALLVVSAHWECAVPTILDRPRHSLIYDYYGFPDSTYHLTYPVAGSATVATRISELLKQGGLPVATDGQRGLDHGVFIPLKVSHPQADIPVVQLSLVQGLDPATHLALGKALQPLRDEGVLIIGSGMSYHNLRSFFGESPNAVRPATAFDNWLGDAVSAAPVERDQLLTAWQTAPGARDCHPRSEHLIPLMVAAGAAGSDPGTVVYREPVMGKPVSAVAFGAINSIAVAGMARG